MTYTLLRNPNPYGEHFYRSRLRPVKAIVVHVTAGLEDQDFRGADLSAEKAARYASITPRKVSWHTGSDSDSVVRLLPGHYTAFHCQGYNSSTVGHEISKTDVTWADEPDLWVSRTLAQAARGVAVDAVRFRIPARHATKHQLNLAIEKDSMPVGFIEHSVLDPERRRDPGKDFPWEMFLLYVTAEIAILRGAKQMLSEEDVDRIADEVEKRVWDRAVGRGDSRKTVWQMFLAMYGGGRR